MLIRKLANHIFIATELEKTKSQMFLRVQARIAPGEKVLELPLGKRERGAICELSMFRRQMARLRSRHMS